MRWISRNRPSPALIVAFIALFVAMSGVGYTAAKINGKRLKTRSVSGSKLKNDTVTGTQVNESSLGAVPSATNATNAASAAFATNADATDGVSEGAFTIALVGLDSTCANVSDAVFQDCVGRTITTPRTANIKVDVFTQWDSDDAVTTNKGAQCRIERNGTAVGSTIDPGTLSNDTDSGNTRTMALGTVDGSRPAGTYTYNLACRADAGDDFDLTDIRTTVLMAGNG